MGQQQSNDKEENLGTENITNISVHLGTLALIVSLIMLVLLIVVITRLCRARKGRRRQQQSPTLPKWRLKAIQNPWNRITYHPTAPQMDFQTPFSMNEDRFQEIPLNVPYHFRPTFSHRPCLPPPQEMSTLKKTYLTSTQAQKTNVSDSEADLEDLSEKLKTANEHHVTTHL